MVLDGEVGRSGEGVPTGAIIMWSGSIASIPGGFVLCDGNNGTPDLRDRFVVCARQDEGGVAKTNLTGALTVSGGSINHGHSDTFVNVSAYDELDTDNPDIAGGGGVYNADTVGHNHTLNGSVTNTDAPQPYYALAFIMKT